jgi:hypothetical protein
MRALLRVSDGVCVDTSDGWVIPDVPTLTASEFCRLTRDEMAVINRRVRLAETLCTRCGKDLGYEQPIESLDGARSIRHTDCAT